MCLFGWLFVCFVCLVVCLLFALFVCWFVWALVCVVRACLLAYWLLCASLGRLASQLVVDCVCQFVCLVLRSCVCFLSCLFVCLRACLFVRLFGFMVCLMD